MFAAQVAIVSIANKAGRANNQSNELQHHLQDDWQEPPRAAGRAASRLHTHVCSCNKLRHDST